MDKYFPSLRLYSLNEGKSVYNKVAWEYVYLRSVFIYTGSQYF